MSSREKSCTVDVTRPETVRQAIAAGVDVNAARFTRGLSHLHGCCFKNNVESARLLLAAGADVNVRDDEKWTPLHLARSGAMAALLLERGADWTAENFQQVIPREVAEAQGFWGVVAAIDEHERAWRRQQLTDGALRDDGEAELPAL